MSKLLASRSAQYPAVAEFVFHYNDWVTDSADGSKKTFGSTVALADPSGAVSGLTGAVAATISFDAINIPLGAVIIGGEVIVETAYATSTAATLSLGVGGGDLDKLTGDTTVDLKTAARTALGLTVPLIANAGTNLRVTMAYTVANATAGKVRVRVMFTTDGRVHDVISS